MMLNVPGDRVGRDKGPLWRDAAFRRDLAVGVVANLVVAAIGKVAGVLDDVVAFLGPPMFIVTAYLFYVCSVLLWAGAVYPSRRIVGSMGCSVSPPLLT